MTKHRGCLSASGCAIAAVVTAAVLPLSGAGLAAAGASPEIRVSETNQVPACATPERLMAFLHRRNSRLEARYKDLARLYKTSGEAWRVRWDYAFFQMAVETNFLSYRRPDGRMGDVDPKQNNFAGIGTTGGGVAGDSYPDIKTGVLAQIEHLVAYSGERIAAPVAPRTRLRQDDIVTASLKLDRPVRFSDLARRWAVDRDYGRSIEWVAQLYRSEYCKDREQAATAVEPLPWALGTKTSAGAGAAFETRTAAPAAPRPRAATRGAPSVRTIWTRSPAPASGSVLGPAAAKEPGRDTLPPGTVPTASPASGPRSVTEIASPAGAGRAALDRAAAPPSGLGVKPETCSVSAASYGGTKTRLIRSETGREVRYVALSVLDGFERSMTDSFIVARAPGGQSIGEFETKDDALAKARELCPGS